MKDKVKDYKNDIEIIGKSEPIKIIRLRIETALYGDFSVLITGETGTGKELIAKNIYKQRKLKTGKKGPFVALNCTGLPETLLESELFGHKKGSYTGAIEDKIGLVEAAENGVLFLDEIGDMPLLLQAKLLRFLQDGSFRRVGESKERKSNPRIISATNKNLNFMMQKSKFRKDLFYRIGAHIIHTAPLRHPAMRKDIPILTYHLIKKYMPDCNDSIKISSFYNLFLGHDWPGNVRELENRVQVNVDIYKHTLLRNRPLFSIDLALLHPSHVNNLDSVIASGIGKFEKELAGRKYLNEDDITLGQLKDYWPEHIPIAMNSSAKLKGNKLDKLNDMSYKDAVFNFGKLYLMHHLARHRNQKDAAKAMGISESTLSKKKTEHKI